MLYPKIIRAWNGYAISGQEYEIELSPYAGEVGIYVAALPPVTGSEYRIAVSYNEQRLYFTPEEVKLGEASLECMKRYEDYTFYREGFTVVLEPGMHAQLKAALPKLFKVAALGKQAELMLSEKCQRPINYMMDFAYSTFARIILDGVAPDRAIELTKEFGSKAWDAEFVAEFESGCVRALLEEAHAAHHQFQVT